MSKICLSLSELSNISKQGIDLEESAISLIGNVNSSLEDVVIANKTEDIRNGLREFYENFGDLENSVLKNVYLINDFFVEQLEEYKKEGYDVTGEIEELLQKANDISFKKLVINNTVGNINNNVVGNLDNVSNVSSGLKEITNSKKDVSVDDRKDFTFGPININNKIGVGSSASTYPIYRDSDPRSNGRGGFMDNGGFDPGIIKIDDREKDGFNKSDM